MHKSAPKFWFNPLITDGERTSHATLGTCLSVGAICFEDRFCTSKNGGIRGGGWVSALGALYMASAL